MNSVKNPKRRVVINEPIILDNGQSEPSNNQDVINHARVHFSRKSTLQSNSDQLSQNVAPYSLEVKPAEQREVERSYNQMVLEPIEDVKASNPESSI
mmetsp:Transcript_26567/g.30688  ORF Transcript_26567/g.30688 Transcript_26567/m.30688 type:complete len:97 (-) Transcript_26567:133-423(-)